MVTCLPASNRALCLNPSPPPSSSAYSHVYGYWSLLGKRGSWPHPGPSFSLKQLNFHCIEGKN